jgi:hypothetical protein
MLAYTQFSCCFARVTALRFRIRAKCLCVVDRQSIKHTCLNQESIHTYVHTYMYTYLSQDGCECQSSDPLGEVLTHDPEAVCLEVVGNEGRDRDGGKSHGVILSTDEIH